MCTGRNHFAIKVAAFITALVAARPATADITISNLGTLGGSGSYAYSISQNGRYIVGEAENLAGESHAFLWENGVMTDIGTLGGNRSWSYDISADGSVMIGTSRNLASQFRAFRWESGVMTDLGTFGGNQSYGAAISADGAVITGSAQNGANQFRAFRWEGGVMTNLGTLGGVDSYSNGMSADGSIIVGESPNAANRTHAFRWEGGVMADLGTLGGNQSSAYGISADGSVIVGSAHDVSNNYHAFSWQGGVMTDLGTLDGAESYAYSVSADGSRIVGSALRLDGNYYATLWDQGVIADLNELVPDLTGWDRLEEAYRISADGNLIVGYGFTDSGDYNAFLLNLNAAAAVTPQQLAQDLAPAIVPASQSREALGSQIGSSLAVARNAALYFPPVSSPRSAGASQAVSASARLSDIEPAAGGLDLRAAPAEERRHAIYAVGSYGWGQGNNDFNSSGGSLNTGILIKPADNVTFGAGIIGARSRLATTLGGESRVNAKGGTILGAYAPEQGLSVYATAAFAVLDAETDRRYLSGAAIDSSAGKTQGNAYGAVARIGYAQSLTQSTIIMPYAEAEVTHTTLDAYNETGGAFAAAIGKQSGTNTTSRIGAELSHEISPDLTLRTRAAWGHRYGDSDPVAATAAALTVSLPAAAGDRNWAEVGASATWRTSTDALLSADVSGRSGETEAPAISLTAAVIVPF